MKIHLHVKETVRRKKMSYLLSWEQTEEHSLFVCLLAPSSSHLVFLFLLCTPRLSRASSVERGLDANPPVTCIGCLTNFFKMAAVLSFM